MLLTWDEDLLVADWWLLTEPREGTEEDAHRGSFLGALTGFPLGPRIP
jgi:hypothetical protein